MNNAILVGNLTADPKLHVSETGKKRATFSLAINEGQGENEKTHFVNLTAFDTLAENIVESFSKGMRVIVGARLNTYKQAVVINGEERQLTMVSYVATHAGPELRFALAKVTKVTREGNGSGTTAAKDTKATVPAPSNSEAEPVAAAPAGGSGDEDDF
ncbi:MAG: single-stranded DNA-binding protein [Actinomycetota bacterium]|jgi:single-strand DNA-binding protein|nr:single-stranded DNA-binding protein [Actinomycetota bacterium]